MAASLSSAEAEELEPTGVFEDEAGCMGLIFWLSGVLVQTVYVLLVDRMSRAKFWFVAGTSHQPPLTKSQVTTPPDPSQGDPFFCSQGPVARQALSPDLRLGNRFW